MSESVSVGDAMQAPVLPGAWPVVGHLPQLLRTPLAFLERQRDQTDVAVLRLVGRDVYIVNTPETTLELLVGRGRDVTKGFFFERLRFLLGNGLANTEGTFHRRQRRLMQPAFHEKKIAKYAAIARAVTLEKTGSWRDHQTVSVHEIAHEIAATVATRSLFSSPRGEYAARELTYCLPVLFKGLLKRVLVPADLLFRLPTPGNRRFEDANLRIHAVVDQLIAEYRDEDVERDDLLSTLLGVRDETGAALSDEQVHDEVLTLLLGGTETVATALCWVFHMLERYSRARDRVQAELARVLGDRDPEFEDVAALDYLRRFIAETMRLYPPGWLLTRCAARDIQIGGYRIPKGANVIFSPYLLHRDPRSFPEPDSFDPDRWLPERAANTPRGAYIPFGVGNRQCIGYFFTQMELAVVVATIARRWRLRLPANAPKDPVISTSLHPEPVLMTLEKRLSPPPDSPSTEA